MMAAVADRALVALEEFYPLDLPNRACAFVTMAVRQEEFLGPIAGKTSVRIEETNLL